MWMWSLTKGYLLTELLIADCPTHDHIRGVFNSQNSYTQREQSDFWNYLYCRSNQFVVNMIVRIMSIDRFFTCDPERFQKNYIEYAFICIFCLKLYNVKHLSWSTCMLCRLSWTEWARKSYHWAAQWRCRAQPSGGITPRATLNSALIRSHLPMGEEFQDYFVTFRIKKCIYLHSHLSTWLHQRSAELTLIVGCLCSIMIFYSQQKQEGMYGKRKKPSAELSKRLSWIQTLSTTVTAVACYFMVNEQWSNLAVWGN